MSGELRRKETEAAIGASVDDVYYEALTGWGFFGPEALVLVAATVAVWGSGTGSNQ